MKLTLSIGKKTYKIDSQPHDIGISMLFNGPQPNTYGVSPAKARPYEGQGFVGDVSQGGSCNFEVYEFVPHCNGTHTECVGHLTEESVHIHEVLQDSLVPATLVSVPLAKGSTQHRGNSYQPSLNEKDSFVGLESLKTVLQDADQDFLEGLIVRTLPNPLDKKSRNYMEGTCPFFSNEAMTYIRELGVKHLLVDFPSVDRLFDEGLLSNHRIYWEMETGSTRKPGGSSMARTITEMIFVPDEIRDGPYLLEMQVAPFMADAAPSRPRLFRLQEM